MSSRPEAASHVGNEILLKPGHFDAEQYVHQCSEWLFSKSYFIGIDNLAPEAKEYVQSTRIRYSAWEHLSKFPMLANSGVDGQGAWASRDVPPSVDELIKAFLQTTKPDQYCDLLGKKGEPLAVSVIGLVTATMALNATKTKESDVAKMRAGVQALLTKARACELRAIVGAMHEEINISIPSYESVDYKKGQIDHVANNLKIPLAQAHEELMERGTRGWSEEDAYLYIAWKVGVCTLFFALDMQVNENTRGKMKLDGINKLREQYRERHDRLRAPYLKFRKSQITCGLSHAETGKNVAIAGVGMIGVASVFFFPWVAAAASGTAVALGAARGSQRDYVLSDNFTKTSQTFRFDVEELQKLKSMSSNAPSESDDTQACDKMAIMDTIVRFIAIRFDTFSVALMPPEEQGASQSLSMRAALQQAIQSVARCQN